MTRPPRTRLAVRRPAAERRGVSLVTVLVPLSASIVLAVAFLSTQSTATRAAQNAGSGDLARQAAETGLAAALDAMQDPAWAGVSSPLSAEVGRDGAGVWSYNVTYSQVARDAGDTTEIGAATAALKARVRSTGTWQAFGSSRSVNRVMEAVVSLSPRLPGRPSRPNDVATASDRATDVSGFSAAQAYAVFAASNGKAFSTEPQTRVAGNVYSQDKDLGLFSDPSLPDGQLDDLFAGLGTDSPGGASAASPHPLAGRIDFGKKPDKGDSDDLDRLGTPYQQVSSLPFPSFDPADYQTYRLFNGGWQYSAASIGSYLQNVSLGPTEANPLGIFYCNGSLTVGDNVTVRGTLVADSDITFRSADAAITAFDWRDGAGGTPVLDRSLWPVLPAVVAGDDVTFSSTNRSFIEGAVLANGDVVANVPDYDRENTLNVYLGNGTAKPLGGGLSEVRLSDLSVLLTLGASSKNEVRIGGSAGRWYPVTSAEALIGGRITVRGTADFPTTTSVEIQPRRLRYAEIAGPVIARHVTFNAPSAWTGLSGSTWNTKYNNWKNECNLLKLLRLTPRTYSAYLGDPLNWLLAGNPYQTYGLPFEPTVRVDRPSNVSYGCEPPLFRPDPSAETAGGGYRWAVLSWREVTP
jgi:hypothetical protein